MSPKPASRTDAVTAGAAGAAPGYSGKPLAAKLGLRTGMRVAVRGYDGDWAVLVAGDRGPVERPVDWTEADDALDLVHLFVTREDALRAGLEAALPVLVDRGMIWVSWPKRGSGVPTEVTEDVIRAVALPMGLVDIKVCAVTEVWSGLKLVRRLTR